MGSIKDEIAKNLQYYRKKKKMTQKELADKIGVRHNSISSWENGVNSIDIETLIHICQVLDVNITDMYGGFNTASPAPADLDENIKKYLLLNAEGKKKAGERIDELLELPKYRNSTSAPLNAHTEEQIAAALKQITEDPSDVGSLLFNLSQSKK